jgi:hypothetical protein
MSARRGIDAAARGVRCEGPRVAGPAARHRERPASPRRHGGRGRVDGDVGSDRHGPERLVSQGVGRAHHIGDAPDETRGAGAGGRLDAAAGRVGREHPGVAAATSPGRGEGQALGAADGCRGRHDRHPCVHGHAARRHVAERVDDLDDVRDGPRRARRVDPAASINGWPCLLLSVWRAPSLGGRQPHSGHACRLKLTRPCHHGHSGRQEACGGVRRYPRSRGSLTRRCASGRRSGCRSKPSTGRPGDHRAAARSWA